jgi:homoserine kinase type II
MNMVENFKQLLSLWGIALKNIRDDIDIHGSPERTNFRVVIEDNNSNLFILENISNNLFKRKKIIAESLFYLKNKDLNMTPYLKSKNNNFIELFKDKYWQIIPFVEGIPLDRTNYLFDSWRGESAAKFLIELKKKSQHISRFEKDKPFSLPSYVHGLKDSIKIHNKDLYKKISPIIDYLNNNFFTIHDQLPIAICHGDYHSLNIIWGDKKIKTVIDWEFIGYKAEGYDIANMVGCLGIEDPIALIDGFTKDFIKTLKDNNFITDKSWRFLVDMIIALRFAWLSEWLRNNDQEMINLEINYMNLLINSKNKLNKIWKI